MGHETSPEKDEPNRIQMQEFAIQAVETIDAQRQLYIQEAGEEIRTHEGASSTLVKDLESRLQNQFFVVFKLKISVYEAIEHERYRLQNQESSLSHEARKQEYQHQQKVTGMQTHHDEASQQSHEEIKTPLEETVALRKETDGHGKFSESMVDWTASEQSGEVARSSHAQPRLW